MSRIIPKISSTLDAVKLELDAAIAAARAFERACGDDYKCMITDTPAPGEAELYRNLRSLKTRYAQLLEAENDEHQEGLWEWAGSDYRGRNAFRFMPINKQTEFVRHCQHKRAAAAKLVRDHPDTHSREFIEARAVLTRAEGEFHALYYWHLRYLVDPSVPNSGYGVVPQSLQRPFTLDPLKREHAKVRRRGDEYSATDMHLIEQVMFTVAVRNAA